jgi:hypothetical protein
LLKCSARETVRGKGLRPSTKSELSPSEISGVKIEDIRAGSVLAEVEEKTTENTVEKIRGFDHFA